MLNHPKKALFLFVLGTAALALSGCGHGPGGRGGAEVMPAVELQGTGSFFKGLVRTTIRLSRADFRGGGPRRAGGEGGGRPHGGGMAGGPPGGGPGGPGGPGGREGPPEEGEMRASGPRIAESNLPGMVFHIEFETTGTSPLTIMVWEFNSALGNFAVRPERLELRPGVTLQVDPMTTRLGAGGEGLEVSLVLRTAGAEERQVIVLHEAVSAPTRGLGPG